MRDGGRRGSTGSVLEQKKMPSIETVEYVALPLCF